MSSRAGRTPFHAHRLQRGTNPSELCSGPEPGAVPGDLLAREQHRAAACPFEASAGLAKPACAQSGAVVSSMANFKHHENPAAGPTSYACDPAEPHNGASPAYDLVGPCGKLLSSARSRGELRLRHQRRRYKRNSSRPSASLKSSAAPQGESVRARARPGPLAIAQKRRQCTSPVVTSHKTEPGPLSAATKTVAPAQFETSHRR